VPQDLPASAKGVAGEDFTATVPVYFRIVTEGTTGAVTNRQVAAQIDVLNTTFGGGEGAPTPGSPSPWRASTAPTTPTGSTPASAAPTSTP